MDASSPRLDDLITAIERRHPDEDPLGRLSDAVMLAQHLDELADHLIGHFVDQARGSGATWTTIGQSMGVTKQAAQKRFVPTAPALPATDLRMFERYTESARAAIVHTQAEARATSAAEIRAGHLLLALLRAPGGQAEGILRELGIDSRAVERAVTATLGGGDGSPDGPLPFAAASRKAIQLGHREALHLGDEHVGVEHLLLGVLRGADEPEIHAAGELGLTRKRVLSRLGTR
jgi:hypothetical protein